jgi:hypothetical protein
MRPLSLLPLLALLGCASLTAIACGGDEGGGTGGTDDGGTDDATGGTGTASGGSGSGGGGSTVPGTCENCSNGCCDGDTCIPFSIQSGSQCGSNGYVCVDCGFGFLCGSTGFCEADPSVCSALTCDGCCNDNTCIPASDTGWTACGSDGGSCTECSYGVVCDGTCTADVDPGAIGFRMTIGTVTLESTNTLEGGDSWDFTGGADPLVCVSNGVDTVCSSRCDDTLVCVIEEEMQLNITGQQLLDGEVLVEVYDYDSLDPNDLAGAAYLTVTALEPFFETGPFGAVTNLSYAIQ